MCVCVCVYREIQTCFEDNFSNFKYLFCDSAVVLSFVWRFTLCFFLFFFLFFFLSFSPSSREVNT